MKILVYRDSNKGQQAGDNRLTAKPKYKDRDNLGKEKSDRMHDKLTEIADGKIQMDRYNKAKKDRRAMFAKAK